MKDISEQIKEKEKEIEHLKTLMEADFNLPINQVRRLVNELPQNGRGISIYQHRTYYDPNAVRIEIENNVSTWRLIDMLKENGFYFGNIYSTSHTGMTCIASKEEPPEVEEE